MRERTMNLKMYSRALRVRKMGSHCSPRLDTSRYLFSTDISFLEENNTRKRYLNYWNWVDKRESEEERKREVEENKILRNKIRKGKKWIIIIKNIIQPELPFPSLMHCRLESLTATPFFTVTEQKGRVQQIDRQGTREGRWRWKNSKVVFHTLTDVLFTQLTESFICPQMNDEKKILIQHLRSPKASLDAHKYTSVPKQLREMWVAESSV